MEPFDRSARYALQTTTLKELSILFFQAPPPPPEPLLQRIVETVAHFRATVPSIVADESILSDLSQHGFYRAHSKATATLRVFATDAGKPLNEVRTYLTVDGKPVQDGKKVRLPFQLNGAFSRVAESIFTSAHIRCVDFTAMPAAADGSLELSFVTKPDALESCGTKGVTVRGLVRVDPATAQIRHLERVEPMPVEKGKHAMTLIVIDYAPVVIGDKTFWLPTRLKADLDGDLGHFTAVYSGFHRFASSGTIVPEEEPTTP